MKIPVTYLVSLTLACICLAKVKATCSKQLGKGIPSQPQIPVKGQEPQTCASTKTCCTRHLEGVLRQKAVSDLKTKVWKRLDGVKGSTQSLRQDIKGYFQGIVQAARRQSMLSLRQSHANLSRIGGPLVTAFFIQVEDYIDNPSVNLTDIVMQFFRDSFPPLFNYASAQTLPFSNQYSKCLKDKVNTIQLFGSNPYRIATEMEKVLKPVQVFLKSFSLATKIIDDSKQISFTKGCEDVLLQMTYCSLCNGEGSSVKPCERYCKDVVKSCLMTVLQIQPHWGVYFDALQALSTSLSNSPNLKNILYSVYNNDLSMAVIQALPQINDPKRKIDLYKVCGKPEFGSSNGKSITKPTDSVAPRFQTSIKDKMDSVQTKMISFKYLFDEMPHDVCILDRVAAPRTEKLVAANCWNGTALGSYSGPVSSPLPSLDALPNDLVKIKTLVEEMKIDIKTMKKYTYDYEEDKEGSAGSGDNSISGSSCDGDGDDCGSGGSGERNTLDNKNNKDDDGFYFSSSSKPSVKPTDFQDGGLADSNVRNSGKNGSATLVSTQSAVFLTIFVVSILSFRFGCGI